MKQRGLARRILGWSLRIVVALLVFVLVAFTAVLFSLRFPKVQAFAATRTNTALADLFKGKIEIQRLGKPSLGGMQGVDARILDPQGRTVIEARGATVDIFWLGVLWQILIQRPQVLSIHIERVELDHARVRLIDDGQGSPTLVHAFEPAKPGPKEASSGGTEVRIPALELRHAWIDGKLGTGPAIDAEIDRLSGSLASLPDRFELDLGMRFLARALPAGADPNGRAKLSLRLPSTPKPRNVVKAEFSGTLAGADATLRFEMHGDELSGVLDAKAIGPKTFAAITSAVQPSAPIGLHAKIEGTLPKLHFEARAEGPSGLATVDGDVRAESTTTITARLRTRDLDAHGLLPDAPVTAITLEASANARIDENGVTTANFRASTGKLVVAAQSLPPLNASGDVIVGKSSELNGSGALVIDEPGATAKILYTLDDVGRDDGVVQASARIAVDDPKRFAKLFSGKGEVAIEAEVRLNQSQLDADLESTLTRVQSSGAAVDRLKMKARVQGALENPKIDGRVEATGISVAGRHFDRAVVTAQGAQKELAVTADVSGTKPDRVHLSTRLALKPEFVLRDSDISLHDGETFEMNLHADRMRLGNGGVQVDSVALDGAGRARASFTWTDRPALVELSAQELQVSKIMAAFGIDPGISVEKVDLDARYADKRGDPVGSVSGAVTGLRVKQLNDDSKMFDDGKLRFDVALANRTVTGTMEAVAPGAEVRLTVDEIRIPAQPWKGEDLQVGRGRLEANGHLDLRRLEPLLTRFLPLGTARGTVDFDVRLDRAREGAKGPRLAARLNAKDLQASGRRETQQAIQTAEVARQTKPWTIDGLDVNGAAELDAAIGLARLDAVVEDRKGTLLTAQLSTKLAPASDFSALFRQQLARVPVEVRLAVPPRALEDLPEMLEPKSLRGVLAVDVAVDGTISDPNLRASANLTCLGTIDTKDTLDLTLDAEYARAKGQVVASASTNQKSIGALRARWDGDVAQLAAPGSLDRPSPIRGDLSLQLDRFPLNVLPALSNEEIRGRISGTVKLDGLGRNAHLKGNLRSDTILVGRVGVQKFDVSVDTSGDQLVGNLEIGGNRGIARMEVRAPLKWTDTLAPILEKRVEGRLYARNFRLETLAPLVAEQVTELQGRLDADVRAQLTDNRPVVEGGLTIEKGVMQIPSIGQRFSKIESKVTINRGDVRLEKFTARGVTGKLTLDGSAKLDGMSLQAAEAHLKIEKDDKIPLTVQGASMGDAWGRVDATLKIADKERETRIRVDVPEFHMELPESTPSVQDLAPEEAIRIGTRLPAGDFVTLPVQPLEDDGPSTGPASTTRIEVKLGNSVWLKKGQQVQAQLGGNILVEQQDTTRITGKIELRGGTLDIQGKRFEIERGVVTFTGGDPSNPTITAGARWDSPEGYAITAEYTGTAQQGKLTLRSEPPLTDNEILSLLMFGTPDGNFGSGSGGTSETALGVAGGTLTQGFNHLLAGLTDLEVSARIDTSTGVARPELVVQISPRLTARVTQALGSPGAGQPPDKTFLTVDFRLRRAWSLSTMVGDRGASALDLIWRKRY